MLWQLFADNLLPVFLAAGAGWLLAGFVRLDARAISHVAFSIFAPCLIYHVIVESRLPAGDVVRMMGFAVVTLFAIGAVAALVARLAGWSRTMASAFVLCAILPNAGNFGLSANALAFGDEALAHASLFFVTSSMITYTVGVLVASLGRASVRDALVGLVRVPAVWSTLLALVMLNRGWSLPGPAARTVGLLADACIPTFLVILGVQLRGAGLGTRPVPLAAAAGLRLVGSAAVALLLAPLFGLRGVAWQTGVLQASMPTAVISIIIATEYDVEPEFVTSVVFLTTLICPLTLTPLLAYLG
jgi:predicted permease